MKWILILLAVNIADLNDIPGTIQIPFVTEIECEKAAAAMTFKSKFDFYKVNAICKKES
jgi:hypothetical protein